MRKSLCFCLVLGTWISQGYAEDMQSNGELNKVESDINVVQQDMQRLSEQKDNLNSLFADI